MTGPPGSPPARSPGHTLRPDTARGRGPLPRGCQLATPGSAMSPSGRLCLLTLLGLILPSRGQTLEETTSSSTANSTTVDTHVAMQVPDEGRGTGTTTFPERQTPSKNVRMEPQTPDPPGSNEDNPFFYDETTLRRRGLLVAAVLFITGIVILTSGKCRQWSRCCWSPRRAYRVVNTRSPEREDPGMGSQTCG
ncbi:FXYD domain-containing ion transport regulator 5 [Castor canadensis]|uniref:FXYD domain-containing ion transport regulator 5 n=1 Tax=Castor canadensis TaxID=51338 RepID=A0AC58LBI7_CASCN